MDELGLVLGGYFDQNEMVLQLCGLVPGYIIGVKTFPMLFREFYRGFPGGGKVQSIYPRSRKALEPLFWPDVGNSRRPILDPKFRGPFEIQVSLNLIDK